MSIGSRSLPSSARRAELLAELVAALTDGGPGIAPLELRDRGLGDPTVALLDAWATVGDVIGFYLDRIADEGYAATAREPGSLLALAGMLGHRPRPGLAATLHLAYTLQTDPDDKAVLLPAGLLSQSVPGPGEQPQTFETTTPLLTRPSWNTLPVKKTAPLTLPAAGAGALEQLVVAGTTNRLSANDAVLLSLAGGGEPAVVRVASATADPKARLTTITLQPDVAPPPGEHSAPPQNAIAALDALTPGLSFQPAPPPPSVNALQRGPSTVFSTGSDAVPRLLAALKPELAPNLYGALASTPIGTPVVSGAAALRIQAAPFGAQAPPRQLFDDRGQPAGTEELPIEDTHVLEFQLGLSTMVDVMGRITPGAGQTFERLQERLRQIHESVAGRATPEPVLEVSCDTPAGSAQRNLALRDGPPWAAELGSLGTVALTPSGDAVNVSYSSSDAKRLPELDLSVSLDPAREGLVLTLDDGQYTWDPSIRRPIRSSIGERRVSISWPSELGSSGPAGLSIRIETPLALADPHRLALDNRYDAILPGSYVVIDRAEDAAGEPSITYPVLAQVVSASPVAVSRYGQTAKVTQLELSTPWIGDEALVSALRVLSVRAQHDPLELPPQPREDEVKDEQIELDGVIAGMEPGHLIAVTGTRSDLPDGTSVSGGEVAMIANVSQGAAADGEEPHTTLQLAARLAFRYARSTVTIYGNVVAAHQGSTVTEVLGSGAPSQRQSFTLSSAPLLADGADGPAAGRSTLSVTVDAVAYDEAARIDSETPRRSFVTDLDSRGHTTITFAGPLPPGNGNVVASYRTGDGSLGNLRPGQLTQLLSRPLGVTGVMNPLPGTGGTAPDGPSQVRAALPAGLGSLGRIVSVSDYADFARSWANVGKSTARIVNDTERDAVLVTVAGDQPGAISQTLCASIADGATASGDPGLPVFVVRATLLTIVLVAGVKSDPRYDGDAIAGELRSKLFAELGYANRALGENVTLSDLTAAAHRASGVLAFTVRALALVPATATAGELADKLPKLLAAGDPLPAVIPVGSARSAWGGGPVPDGSEPDAIAYLDPSVPDTLMLTEENQ